LNHCFAPYRLGTGQFKRKMTIGILQYVPIKLLTALATFILDLNGLYGAGEFRVNKGYPYIALVTNTSQMWAMYCLVLFYHVLYEDMKEIHPLAKFLSVKLVVFATFWQSVLIAFFVDMHFIQSEVDYTTDQVALGFQDFCICIEMFIAAVAHICIYPHNEFVNPHEDLLEHKGVDRLRYIANPKDLLTDVHRHMVGPVGRSIKKHTKKVVIQMKRVTLKTKTAPQTNGNQTDPKQPLKPENGYKPSDEDIDDLVSSEDEKDIDERIPGYASAKRRASTGETRNPVTGKIQTREEIEVEEFLAPRDDTIHTAIFSVTTETEISTQKQSHQDRPLIY